jgi:hypothetical protein
LTHDVNEIADLYFDLYNVDGSDTVSRAEIVSMLVSTRAFSAADGRDGLSEDTVPVDALLASLSRTGDWSVTRDEWRECCKFVGEGRCLPAFGRVF